MQLHSSIYFGALDCQRAQSRIASIGLHIQQLGNPPTAPCLDNTSFHAPYITPNMAAFSSYLVSTRRGRKMLRLAHSLSLCMPLFPPLVYISCPPWPLNVIFNFVPLVTPDGIGVPTLETAAVDWPSAGVELGSSKSWNSGHLAVSSFNFLIHAAYGYVSNCMVCASRGYKRTSMSLAS